LLGFKLFGAGDCAPKFFAVVVCHGYIFEAMVRGKH
jgi:hypothetical protein